MLFSSDFLLIAASLLAVSAFLYAGFCDSKSKARIHQLKLLLKDRENSIRQLQARLDLRYLEIPANIRSMFEASRLQNDPGSRATPALS
jgi:hypothetical protein